MSELPGHDLMATRPVQSLDAHKVVIAVVAFVVFCFGRISSDHINDAQSPRRGRQDSTVVGGRYCRLLKHRSKLNHLGRVPLFHGHRLAAAGQPSLRSAILPPVTKPTASQPIGVYATTLSNSPPWLPGHRRTLPIDSDRTQ